MVLTAFTIPSGVISLLNQCFFKLYLSSLIYLYIRSSVCVFVIELIKDRMPSPIFGDLYLKVKVISELKLQKNLFSGGNKSGGLNRSQF